MQQQPYEIHSMNHTDERFAKLIQRIDWTPKSAYGLNSLSGSSIDNQKCIRFVCSLLELECWRSNCWTAEPEEALRFVLFNRFVWFIEFHKTTTCNQPRLPNRPVSLVIVLWSILLNYSGEFSWWSLLVIPPSDLSCLQSREPIKGQTHSALFIAPVTAPN